MRQRPALLAIYRARVNALSATQDLGRKKISPAVEGSGHVDVGPPSVCPCCRWHGVTARTDGRKACMLGTLPAWMGGSGSGGSGRVTAGHPA